MRRPVQLHAWRGGLYVYPQDGSGTACTWGFNARSQSSSQKYMIIAGHCGQEVWKHDGLVIGSSGMNTMLGGGTPYADVQRVPITGSIGNLIFVSGATKARAMTAWRGSGYQLNGDSACASGVTSGYRCGVITDNGVYYGLNGLPGHPDMYFWGIKGGSTSNTMPTDLGDSGGPVFINQTLLGIVSAKDGGGIQTVWGPMDYVDASVSVRPCLNSACT